MLRFLNLLFLSLGEMPSSPFGGYFAPYQRAKHQCSHKLENDSLIPIPAQCLSCLLSNGIKILFFYKYNAHMFAGVYILIPGSSKVRRQGNT